MKRKMEKHVTKDLSTATGWDSINDLSFIPENEDIINEYLLHRLERGLIYTWVGPILLSLNPEQNIFTDLYDSSKYKDFFNASEVLQKDIKPHVFAVAARSHYKLLHGLGQPTQVILISGDSGAGKTFNANQAINFLAAINESSSALQLRGKRLEEFVGKIVSACPLITAFSTARTSRNARSSRHGQLIRFEYENGVISGASIQSFLLERSRVTRGSDNFAIFYQLLFGSSDCELEKLGLSEDKNYKLLGTNNYIENDEILNDFQETLNAMKAIGFLENERNEIFKMIALLIHLGNISFNQSTSDGCSGVDRDLAESREALKNVSALTGLSEQNLDELLTTSLICPKSQWRRHSAYHRNLASIEICQSRLSSIIRHIYDNLFHWLIYRINKTLSDKVEPVEHRNWLGIMDIFGFESFSTNGIEELSINYVNERLQLHFMQEYLEAGQRDLWEEGLINLQTPDAINIYRDRLGVIENKLFATLNDASHCPVQHNLLQLKEQFLESANSNFLKHSQNDETFVIKHYARPVEYSLQDLLSKNSDKVPYELAAAFAISSNKFLRSLLEMSDDQLSYQGNKIYARKGTTVAKVKLSLDALLRDLKKCDIHYIKCIRPRLTEGGWEISEFKEQLACTGVLDALPLARCKFAIRLSYTEFINLYSRKTYDTKVSNELCKSIVLQEITGEEMDASLIYFGKRMVFLNELLFFKLKSLRKEYLNQCAKKIQKFWKNYLLQKTLRLNTKKNSFIDCKIEKSLSEDKKYRLSLSDYDCETFMSVDNKDSSRIETPDSFPDVNNTNSQDFEIEPQKSTESQISVEYKFPDDNYSKFYRDLKHTSHFCPEVRRYKTIFVSQWVNNIPVTSGVEGMLRGMQGTKERSERQTQQLLRIKNSLHTQPNENGNGCTISFGNYSFFYKDRILSRQRLAEVPIRFHTRLTCLSNSHRLPRSEFPRGLEDCL